MTSIALDIHAWKEAETSKPELASRRVFFNKLVDEYSDHLYRYAYWLCHNQSVAEDLVQETFLRAWRSLGDLRDVKAAKSWLFTILRRENARQYERVQPDWSEEGLDTLSSQERPYDTSTEAFVLRQALAELSEEYREPLVLQVVGGYSYEDIAEHLQLSKSAVTSRLFRARQKLHRALMGE